MTLQQLGRWFDSFDDEHLILGYGSLINADSRRRFSDMHHDGLLVQVAGFARGWITRSLQEQQTYVGAWPETGASLNALMLPTALSPSLARREKDYTFVQVSPQALRTDLDEQAHLWLHDRLAAKKIWICQSLHQQQPNADFPVSQSYVDTCLAGCLERGGEASAREFIQSTTYWPSSLYDDRTQPVYPRPGRVTQRQHQQIDNLLKQVAQ
ncbi:gamma-glutamylcyclotransferase [Salinimonas marina]|uniref:Gamma-glutamylcyclotransferase n=1 Tax=Salinimonas marina TaxID=2785918 RepID=A0A7S9DWS2_9ALTE|nr:gamma-glutamylcyclotransferase [Salinimonas marina]QPG05280.1 gamma-glutamylcyclotransferase [Salinimonas marina]